MKLLFVVDARDLDKVDSGASVRSTLFLKALAQLGHVDVISFFKLGIASKYANCDVINADVESLAIPKYRSFPGRFWINFLFRIRDPYTYYKFEPVKERFIDDYVRTHEYDFIACRYLEEASRLGLLKYKDRLLLDIDDNPSKAFRISLDNQTFPSAYMRWKSVLLSKTIGLMIKKVLPGFRCVFYSNPLEKPFPKSVLLRNTAASEFNIPDLDDSAPRRILLVGFYYYLPNREGVIHFTERIFPIIKSAVPDVEFHIAGLGLDPDILERLNAMDGIKALGYVKDLEKEYRETMVIIIPIFQGSGTCIKFVEGLKTNRPMVSTPVGSRGFDEVCKDGEHFLLARDDKEFAEKVIRLLKSPEESRRVAHNALQAGKAHFSQEAFMSVVKEAVLSCAQQKQG